MKPNERIPLHDHANNNAGGRLDAATINGLSSDIGGSAGGVTGADRIAEDLLTADTDTRKRLAPDGAGGVEFRQVDVDELTTSETDTTKVARPDGLGGVEFSAEPFSDDFLVRRGGELGVVATTTDSGSALTLDLSAANTFDTTLTANCTLSFINPPASGELGEWTIILRQDATGSRTVTWPASVKWQAADGTNSGSAPTLYTAATAEDVITLSTLDGGTTYGAGQERNGVTGLTGFATPAVVLGTAAAAGSATTAIRSDSTIVAFDATAPTTSAIGDAAATGSQAKAARRDHVHGREALSTATPLVESGSGATGTAVLSSREDHVHPAAAASSTGPAFTIIGQETRTSDGSTTTWLLDNDFEANSVQAFNLTSGKALVVTETLPNTVVIGAAGTSGDTLSFAYAASAI